MRPVITSKRISRIKAKFWASCAGSVNCLLLLCSLLVLAPPVLAAQTLEQILIQAAESLQSGRARQALEILLAEERAYVGQTEFDYLLGVVALECQENSLALHAFERVTLQTPEHAGAWIDLALTHVRMGEWQTAEALLRHVEQTFDPPPELQRQIRSVRQQLQQSTTLLAQGRPQPDLWHGEWSMQAGHTSNANAGTATSGVTLTPSGGDPVYLALDPSRHPRAGALLQSKATLQRTTWIDAEEESAGISEWLFQLREKVLPNADTYNVQDIGGMYTREQPLFASLGWGLSGIWGAGWQNYQMGGASLLDSLALHVGIRQPGYQNCSLLYRAETEFRDYHPSGYADARLQWLSARLLCSQSNRGFSLGARWGVDYPENERPGGTTQRQEISADFYHQLTPTVVLELSWLQGKSSDAHGYSLLVENGRQRQTQKTVWRAGVNWQFNPQWSLIGVLEDYREEANMPLFNFSERQLLAGLRYRF